MQQPATTKNVDILATLDDQPQVSFFPWEMEVQDTAASMAQSIHPQGLLSAILTDEQWAAYPGNSTTDLQGQIQVKAKYQPPAYVDINDQMSSVELYVAKAQNDRLQIWIDSAAILKRAVIKSLGRVVRQVIQDSRIRFQQMSVLDIITKVRARYGQMQKDTKLDLQERMLTMLTTMDDLDTHIANLQEMFNTSGTAGFPVDQDRQVEIFRETICAQPLIAKVLEKFDMKFPTGRGVTYDQLSAYLILHLPALKHAQMAATRANAHLAASTAFAALETESKRLQAQLDQAKRKRGPKSTKNQNKNNKKRNGQAKQHERANDKHKPSVKADGTSETSTAGLNYCHAHGYQGSHTSAECKVLNSDKRKYTNEMRRAKNPNHPRGGSTKVNGQVVQTQKITANLVYDPNEDHEILDDEAATFLASVLNEQDQAEDYETEDVTAMMTDDIILLENDTQPRANMEIDQSNESEDDASDHTRVCGPVAGLITHPAQAVTTQPAVTAGSHPHDRPGFGQASRKGPDLGGSKAVGVIETVATSVPAQHESSSIPSASKYTLIEDGTVQEILS